MKVLRVNQLFEKNLDLSDLDGRSQDGSLTRGDTLIQKLSNDIPIEFSPKETRNSPPPIISSVEDGKKISSLIANSDGSYNPQKALDILKQGRNYTKIFKVGDYGYRLSDIKKTAEFGSSGGRGLGSAKTLETESIQCLFLSMMQDITRNLTIHDYTDIDIEMYSSDIVLPEGFILDRNILNKYSNNKSWVYTFITVANSLFNKGTLLVETNRIEKVLVRTANIDNRYIFYHGDSDFSKEIFNKFTSFHKKINRNKWMPVDVWAVRLNMIEQILEDVHLCVNMEDLNLTINRHFNTGAMRGISLKKINPRGSERNIVINSVTPKPEYHYHEIYVSDNPGDSIAIDILATIKSSSGIEKNRKEKMQIRSRGGESKYRNISGEILLGPSKMGSVSLTTINKYLKSHRLDEIETLSTLRKKSEQELKDDIINIYNGMVDPPKFGGVIDRKKPHLISIYQSLRLADILLGIQNKQKRDRIIQDIYYRALAIPVEPRRGKENIDYFVTPKYARVV